MNKCENCGFLHYRTDPCRVAKKPMAATISPASTDHGLSFTSSAGTDEDKYRQPNSLEMAYEQPKAPGSSPGNGSREDHRPVTCGKLVTAGETATKPRGRPRIHPDRKAYKAQHERDRRARKKESGNV